MIYQCIPLKKKKILGGGSVIVLRLLEPEHPQKNYQTPHHIVHQIPVILLNQSISLSLPQNLGIY